MKKIVITLIACMVSFASAGYQERVVNNSSCTLVHIDGYQSPDVKIHESSDIIEPHSEGMINVSLTLKSVLGDVYNIKCGNQSAGQLNIDLVAAKRLLTAVANSDVIEATLGKGAIIVMDK